mgnify:FL=1
MCGICGIIQFDGSNITKNEINVMMSKMKHRGPDSDGIFLDKNIGFGHLRLSIIDLTPSADQPMFSDDNRYVVVYNGEIYNYLELKQLLSKRFTFKTKSDTEVLINAYRHWDIECLNHFNGMFAFAIYDRHENSVFIARDRFGIKPFYYYLTDDKFIFASEIAPILTVLKHNFQPNDSAIFDYLMFNRTDHSDSTFFKGIKKLQHGYYIEIKGNKINVSKWYNLKESIGKPFKKPSEFKETLSSSIKLRLRSDVPVGVCMSGGLDSSSIVSIILNDYQKRDINTFSAIFSGNDNINESRYIDEYKNKIDNMHIVEPTGEMLYEDLDSFLEAHYEPVPSLSIYAQYKVMEMAKNHVVVTLDGQGADEQLAGYHYFFGIYFKYLIMNFMFHKLVAEAFHYHSKHKSIYGLQMLTYFMLPSKLKSMIVYNKRNYIRKSFINNYKDISSITENLFSSDSIKMASFDHFEYKLEHLLKWEDRNSMWFSLEARVPFLDHRLVERTLALPPEMIINEGQTKQILRQSLGNLLPETIRNRNDKIGFWANEEQWFRSQPFKDFIYDILHSNSFKHRGYIDYEKAIKIYEKHLDGSVDASQEIWKWINLELWFQKFLSV